jgi:hypothetical protein
MQEEEDIEFMLRRTLGICLTDPKKGLSGGRSLGFAATSLANTTAARVFYRPLLSMVNILRMITSFRLSVLGFVQFTIDHADKREESGFETGKEIDWECTAERLRQGKTEMVFCSGPDPWSTSDGRLAALTLHEFRSHCRLLLDVLSTKALLPKGQFLTQSAALLTDFLREVDDIWERASAISCLPLAWAQTAVAGPMRELESALSDFAGIDRHNCFDIYRKETEELFGELSEGVRVCVDIARWRRQYLSFDSGLGAGDKMQYLQARDAAHLYEIWCFAEMANALVELGHQDVLQYSILRSGAQGPTFMLTDRCDAYYNFFGNRISVAKRSKIFARTHVEWFVMNRRSDRDSLVIDTKYREWSSTETLKVLGYMNDFDVNRGAVIYREEIPPGEFASGTSDGRFVVERFGPSLEKLLCVATLKPEEVETESNTAVLQRFIAEVVK